jgi:hypothetical protein
LIYVLIIFYTVKKTIPTMGEITSGWAPNQAVKEAGFWLRSYDPRTKATFAGDVFWYSVFQKHFRRVIQKQAR